MNSLSPLRGERVGVRGACNECKRSTRPEQRLLLKHIANGAAPSPCPLPLKGGEGGSFSNRKIFESKTQLRHQRRHRRMHRLSSARPAEDGRHAPAGFLARGSGASPAFPFPVALWRDIAAYSCGGSRGFDRVPYTVASTRVLVCGRGGGKRARFLAKFCQRLCHVRAPGAGA